MTIRDDQLALAADPALQPVLFTAHGSPMNALGDTPLAAALERWGRRLPRPRALLVVSAHWETAAGLVLGGAAAPATLHDFYGFPHALYTLRYPAPGSPALADEAAALLDAAGLPVRIDPTRGLDHGAWAPLRFLFPRADVPVVPLSLWAGLPGSEHWRVGRALAGLRRRGVLIVASGNLVHNLATADLRASDLPVPAWAADFDAWCRRQLETWDLEALRECERRAPEWSRAHPTREHFVPLLVACGAATGDAPQPPAVTWPHEGFEHATLSQRCVQLG